MSILSKIGHVAEDVGKVAVAIATPPPPPPVVLETVEGPIVEPVIVERPVEVVHPRPVVVRR